MTTRLRQLSHGTVSRQAFPYGVHLTISDPEVQNGYNEAFLLKRNMGFIPGILSLGK